jgi:hypothetical protein
MSRIYIGSVNFDVSEDHIRSVFGIYGPIKNVNMSIDPATGVTIYNFYILSKHLNIVFLVEYKIEYKFIFTSFVEPQRILLYRV